MGNISLDAEQVANLARAVLQQRLAIGLPQKDVAKEAGVSIATWNIIENGKQESFQLLKLAGVLRVLGWPLDALNAILAGDPPEPAPKTRRRPTDVPARMDEVEARLTRVETKVAEILEALPGDEGVR